MVENPVGPLCQDPWGAMQVLGSLQDFEAVKLAMEPLITPQLAFVLSFLEV